VFHRRKQREAKKYGKQVAAEVRKERSASKKANVDAMTKLRKQRAKRCKRKCMLLLLPTL
jgi:rRNA-processing protein EBP2